MLARKPEGIEALEKGIFKEDWESVLQKIRKDYLVRKTGHYFFQEELEALSQKLVEQGFPLRANKVLEFNLEFGVF